MKSRRWLIVKGLAGVVLVAGLIALWAWTPIGEVAKPDRLAEMVGPLAERWWSFPAAAVGFALALLLFVPMTVSMMVLVLLFGTWKAFLISWIGATLSAALGHSVGRFLWHEAVRKLVGKRWDALTELLKDNDFKTTIVLRLIPVTPFTLVNLVAGSVHIRLGYFVIGTVIGSVPFLALLCFASETLIDAIRDPSATTVSIAIGVVALMIAIGIGAEWYRRKKSEETSL